MGEECDDGNLIDGDGCSSSMEIEEGIGLNGTEIVVPTFEISQIHSKNE